MPFSVKRKMKNEVTLKSARKDNDEAGIERVNHARIKPTGLKSCWYDAYPGLFAKCSDNTTTDDNERRKSCHTKSPMKNCLEKLDNTIHTYRQFFLETNSICHQLQYNYFRHQTEKLVNQLVISANYAEEKLDTIEENSEHLLQDSKDIHDSLTKTDRETQEVAQTSKNVSNQINGVLKQSELVFEQSVKIATSQSKMQKGQETMKINLEEGMTMIHEYHNNLRMGIHNLQNETGEIEKTINKVGDVNLLNRDSPK